MPTAMDTLLTPDAPPAPLPPTESGTAPDLPSPKGRGAGGEGIASHSSSPTTTRHPSSLETRNAKLATHSLPPSRRDQAERIWRGLLAQTGCDGLTTSWEWVGAWLDAYGHLVPHRFLVATDPATGDPVAIALATRGRGQRRGPLPVRTAHLGTSGEGSLSTGGIGGVYVEHNRILALPGRKPAALAAFTEALASPALFAPALGRLPTPLARLLAGPDLVELDGFDPEELGVPRTTGPGADPSSSLLPASSLPGFTLDRQTCRIVDLAALRATGTPLEKAFGGQIGRKLRKNARWFEERHGPLVTEWITEPARAQLVFTELIDLHQARWVAVGEPGSFASRPLVAFHRALIDRLLPTGKIALLRVTAGDTLVGVSYAFAERGVVNHYQWGLMAVGPEDGSLSPGFIVAQALLRESLERGHREVNWLGGDARWKRELSTADCELVWATRPLGPWPKLIAAAIRAKRTAQRAKAAAAPRIAPLRAILPASRSSNPEPATRNQEPATSNLSAPSSRETRNPQLETGPRP